MNDNDGGKWENEKEKKEKKKESQAKKENVLWNSNFVSHFLSLSFYAQSTGRDRRDAIHTYIDLDVDIEL